MSSFRADQILERMNQRDPDMRYMALTDLYNECLKDNFKLDADSEAKIVNRLLQMIAEDSSGDVKGLSVKCLAPLTSKLSEKQVGVILDGPNGLSKNIFSTKSDMEETKDISTIGMKFIIAEAPETPSLFSNLFITKLVPNLTEQIQKSTTQDTVWFCLDIVNDLLGKWGRLMAADVNCFKKLQTAVLPHLNSENSRARKKAIGCLGYLAVSLPDDLLGSLTEYLIKNAITSKNTETVHTFIQAIAAISRTVGSRLGKHLPEIIRVIAMHTDKDMEEEDENLSQLCEIRDTCFQVLESLLLRCPKETDKSYGDIEGWVLKFLVWDPLVNDDYDDDEMEEEDDGFMDDSNEASVGDDDLSWKVRKSSARCITVIIKTRPEKLEQVYNAFLPVVISRIGKEREENVKLDLMSTVVSALVQTSTISTGQSHNELKNQLQGLVSDILKGLQKELVGKSPKTKIGAFQLLRELVSVIPECLDGHIQTLIPGLLQALDDKATSLLKIEALSFMRAFMSHQGAAVVFTPNLDKILPAIFRAISDPYYKINAEGLRVLTEIVKILASPEGHDSSSHIPKIYSSTLSKLTQLDIDLEVKEGAIGCAGLLISLLGDKLSAGQINESLTILVQRLTNEVTRLATVKTIDSIASSKLKLDISSVLGDILNDLASFLKKKSRPLKQSALSALISIIKTHGKSKAASSAHFETVLKEVSTLVSEQDLHLAHLSLSLTSSILEVSASSADSVVKLILPNVYKLLQSSLLQGVALHSLLGLYNALLNSKSSNVTFQSLLNGLNAVVTPSLSRQSHNAVAQCIAVLVAHNEGSAASNIKQFINNAKNAKEDHVKLSALLTLGEIGARLDLSSYADLKKNITAAFESSSEDIKSAASVAFGCIAVGNMSKFLPEVLSEVDSNPKRKYLLLGSLREVIVRLSESTEGKENLSKHFDTLLSLFFQNTAQEEEGTRNVVSECLGKLALINPQTVVSQLNEKTKDSNTFTRACITTAIKFTIFEKSHPIDSVLKEHIDHFLRLLKDTEIPVRKSVLLSLNHITYLKPNLVRELLPTILPNLYGETKIKPELIHEVDVGPFKHKVDMGIELRQAAFECMYTLLDTCLSSLDLQEFVLQLVSGLGDEYDIKMLNHLILIRLTKMAGAALLGGVDKLVEPLRVCVSSKPKDATVQQQVERNNEMIRSALRAVYAINQIPGIDCQPKFIEFLKSIVEGPLKDQYQDIVNAATELRV